MNASDTVSTSIQIILLVASFMLFIYALWVIIKQNPYHIHNEQSEDEDFELFVSPEGIDETQTNHLLHNIDAFNHYSQQIFIQTRFSFWFSLISASIGFILITLSLFKMQGDMSYTGTLSGIVLESVAGLFFYQSNRTQKAMIDFFEKLRNDNRVKDALELCNSIEDVEMKNQLKSKLALHFVGIRSESYVSKKPNHHYKSSAQ